MIFQALVLAMAAAAQLAHAEEAGDVCVLPIVRGPCKGFFPSFGFNIKTGKCEAFTYGGCGGNENNFVTLEECQALCDPPPAPEDVCELPIVRGPCKAAFPRFGFNTKTGKCEPFTYGGCAGNENNFETLEECTALCPPEPLPSDRH